MRQHDEHRRPRAQPAVKLKMPSTTNPRWLTEEYAISFFMFGCTMRYQRAIDDADDAPAR